MQGEDVFIARNRKKGKPNSAECRTGVPWAMRLGSPRSKFQMHGMGPRCCRIWRWPRRIFCRGGRLYSSQPGTRGADRPQGASAKLSFGAVCRPIWNRRDGDRGNGQARRSTRKGSRNNDRFATRQTGCQTGLVTRCRFSILAFSALKLLRS